MYQQPLTIDVSAQIELYFHKMLKLVPYLAMFNNIIY